MLRTACSGGKNNLTVYSSAMPNAGVSVYELIQGIEYDVFTI